MRDEELREKANRIHKLKETPQQLFEELDTSPTELLCAMLPAITSTGSLGAQYEAVRQGIEAILSRRHTVDLIAASDRVVQTMKKLDRSTNRLSIVGLILATLVGIAQILVPLWTR